MILRLFEQVIVTLICFTLLPWLQFALNFNDLSVGHRMFFAFFHLQNILVEAYIILTIAKIARKKKRQLEVIKKASKEARMDRLHLPPTFYDIGSFNRFFHIIFVHIIGCWIVMDLKSSRNQSDREAIPSEALSTSSIPRPSNLASFDE